MRPGRGLRDFVHMTDVFATNPRADCSEGRQRTGDRRPRTPPTPDGVLRHAAGGGSFPIREPRGQETPHHVWIGVGSVARTPFAPPSDAAHGWADRKRGTQESNLALRFWRPRCYRYTSPPVRLRIVDAGLPSPTSRLPARAGPAGARPRRRGRDDGCGRRGPRRARRGGGRRSVEIFTVALDLPDPCAASTARPCARTRARDSWDTAVFFRVG